MNFNSSNFPPEQLEEYTLRVLDDICGSLSSELAEWDTEVLREFKETLVHDLLKLGPLEPLLSDDSITEIMVVDENRIYCGKERTDLPERLSVQEC